MFTTTDSHTLAGADCATLASILTQQETAQGLSLASIAEVAGVSAAMVLRVSLALTCTDAHLALLVDHSFESHIGLACARQLMHAGACIHVCQLPGSSPEPPLPLLDYLYPHLTSHRTLNKQNSSGEILALAEEVHAFVYCPATLFSQYTAPPALHRALNEQARPVHCLVSPPGISEDSETPPSDAIVAASTLSIGLPLRRLERATSYVGRHYIADGLLPTRYYSQGVSPFHDQPVRQLFPATTEEKS